MPLCFLMAQKGGECRQEGRGEGNGVNRKMNKNQDTLC